MRTLLIIAVLLAFTGPLGAAELTRDFVKDSKGMDGIVKAHRADLMPDKGVWLRGAGAILTADTYGPGVYHVRFLVDESDPKFQYHTPMFVFGVQDASKAKDANAIAALVDLYAIMWRNTGDVEFQKSTAPKNPGEKVGYQRLGQYKEPGPAPETKYVKDKAVDLTVVIPEKGGEIKVYLNKATPEGEPNCTFTLPDDLKAGSFGFNNGKDFSSVYIQAIDYHPLPAKP
jgi:hypothetical protein